MTGRVASPIGVPDRLTVEQSEALARELAPLRISGTEDSVDPLITELGLPDLLGIGDVTALDVAALWQPRPQRDRLRIPIGVTETGAPVELDIKESAQGGMGPHGLLVGATGSGKSELLRTLVLGLAVTHSSETLNFVLVDFKGGATFLGLDRLPHTSAVITNLAEELPLVDRMHDALHGELVRRQELLRAAGNISSQRDYEQARERGAPLAPLPSLFVIVDEFSELLSSKPEFIELFVMIGRLGRSLGVHLLLASQRLDEGRLRGLETHLSYRIGLRMFSGMESRAVLGAPDAYELPSTPGSGYLRLGHLDPDPVQGRVRLRSRAHARRPGSGHIRAARRRSLPPHPRRHVAGRCARADRQNRPGACQRTRARCHCRPAGRPRTARPSRLAAAPRRGHQPRCATTAGSARPTPSARRHRGPSVRTTP